MNIAKVIIEYSAYQIDKVFDYLFTDEISVVKGCRVEVPFNNKKNVIGYVLDTIKVNKSQKEIEDDYGFELKFIEKVIDKESLLNEEMTSIAYFMQKEYFAPLISCFQTMLPKSLKPKSVKQSSIIKKQFINIISSDLTSLSPKQLQSYHLIKNNPSLPRSEIGITPSILKSLLEKKVIELEYRSVYRKIKIEENSIYQQEYSLTSDQDNVYQQIIKEENKTFLLEGVTGSGKSEVYLKLTQYYLSQGKSVVVLLPEIILTSQLASRFKHYFGSKLALLHSGLSEGEKYDEYRRIKNNEAQVVIGTRSAIFAPCSNLGLIIIDEEHSPSYKQETTPCYHTLDIASFRANYHHINLVLGSATPSLESKIRARLGNYVQLLLSSRINQSELPKCTLVDMNKEKNIISKYLKEEIDKRIENKEQVILLLNRRGYAPYVRCKMCGYVYKCPTCNVSLNYHKASNNLKCHYCGSDYRLEEKCPSCKSNFIEKGGYGTQKIEEMIKEIFPRARVLRMDLDSTVKKDSHQEMIKKVVNNEVDILIGTQMVAKGLNFPNVTLVGVLNADAGLNSADLRANERVFQLLVQVLGRSGRFSKKGEAIIQTYNPAHKTLLYASVQDYHSFFEEELKYRKQMNYPPFRIITYLYFQGKDFLLIDEVAKNAKNYLSQFSSDEFVILGPSVPYLSKIGEEYRLKLMIKYKNKQKTIEIINDLRLYLSRYKSVKVLVNVDPYEEN